MGQEQSSASLQPHYKISNRVMNRINKLVLATLLASGLVLSGRGAARADEPTDWSETAADSSQISSQADIKNLVENRFDSIGDNIIDEVKSGFGSIFNDVIGFFKGLEDLNQDIIGVIPPDWGIVRETVESNSTVVKDLAQHLENRASDSFHSIQDEAEQIQRELIADTISESTTSIEAQKATAEVVAQIEGILERSGELSEDSAKTDVSQQILQNISEQNGITTQLLGIISSQNIQFQRDRASQTNLLLQSSRALAIANNRQRIEAMSASEYGLVGLSSVATPIFLYEEETP